MALHIVVVLVLAALPLFADPFRVTQITQILIIALAVMGLNLLTGFTGQISVGHSVFFGFGAYAVGLISAQLGLPPLVSILLGTVVAGVAGAAIGIPSIRIKGTSLTIVTLVAAAVFPSVLNMFSSITGGTQGMRVKRIEVGAGSILAVDQWRYYVVLIVLILVALAIVFLDRSRIGRQLRALGDNEIAAATFGVHSARLRIGIFTASAAITGLAGALFAVTNGFLSSGTSYVTILGSIELLTALVIGGRAILLGPLLGAAIAELVPAQIGRSAPQLAYLVYGVILIVILLLAPQGLTSIRPMRWIRSRITRVNRRKESHDVHNTTSL